MSNTAFYRRFIFLALLFCACVQYFSESLNSVALYAILPVSFIISFVHNRGLRTNKYESILLILCAWAFASFFWATYPEAAVVELHQLIGVVMLSFVIAVYAKSSLNIELIYLVFLFLLISCWVYAKFNILPEMSEYDRMNDATLDANTFSYFTSFCTFGIYMLGICVGSQEKQHFYKMLFLLMIPISFVTSLLTASRQILLIQIPFCLALTYLRYFYHQNSPRKLKLFVVFILVFLLLSPIAISLFNNSYLHERFSSSSSNDSRILLLYDAFQVGLDHFPLGVGAGNYIQYSYNSHFSHNTYLELWANLGVVGVILFVFLLYTFIVKQYKRYMLTGNKIFLEFLIFGINFCIQNIFYSFYTGLWLMGFFILVCTHSETYFYENYLDRH